MMKLVGMTRMAERVKLVGMTRMDERLKLFEVWEWRKL